MALPQPRPRRTATSLPLLVAAVLALITAPADAATFGPALNAATANYQYNCEFAGGYQGCTLQDPLQDDMELVLPDPVVNGNQTGVVTAISVKSAASAPAQFVVVEWSGRPSEANPFPSGVMAVSQQVTLQPGINNFNTNLPVDRRLAPNGFESWSVVSLNILNGTSPIPAEAGGSFATTGFLLDNGLPLTQTVEDLTVPPHKVSVGGLPPAKLLMSGELTITPKPPPPPPPPPLPPPPLTPPGQGVQLPAVDQAVLGLPVVIGHAANPPTARTRETVTAPLGKAAGARAKHNKRARTVTIALGSTTVPSGKTVSLTVNLTAVGKAQLRKHHSLTATITLVATGPTGRQQTLRRTVTLRLKKRR